MSFFYDILKNINVNSDNSEIVVTMILGEKFLIVGDVKVFKFDDKEILFDIKKDKFKLIGNDLKIDTMSKGEIGVSGNVLGFLKDVYGCSNKG